MNSIIKITTAVLCLFVLSEVASAQTQKRGTREEAIAIAKKVKQLWKTLGPAKTIHAVNKLTHNLRDKDLYPFIGHTDGYVVAHFFTALRGIKTATDTDSAGRSIMGNMIRVFKSTGTGWVQYNWPNPITKQIDAKESYIEPLNGEYFAAVGVFRRLKPGELTD